MHATRSVADLQGPIIGLWVLSPGNDDLDLEVHGCGCGCGGCGCSCECSCSCSCDDTGANGDDDDYCDDDGGQHVAEVSTNTDPNLDSEVTTVDTSPVQIDSGPTLNQLLSDPNRTPSVGEQLVETVKDALTVEVGEFTCAPGESDAGNSGYVCESDDGEAITIGGDVDFEDLEAEIRVDYEVKF